MAPVWGFPPPHGGMDVRLSSGCEASGGLQLARISWIYLCLPLAPGDIIVLSHPFYQVQFMAKAHTETLAHFLQLQQFVIHCAFLFVLYPFIIFSHIFYPLHSFFLPPACQLRHGHTTYIM